MMKKTTTLSFVVACLLSDAQSVSFRPPEGSVPWHKKAKRPCRDEDLEDCDDNYDASTGLKYKVNYTVPNFGVDSDIETTNINLEAAEKLLDKKIGEVTSDDVPKGSKVFHEYEMKKLPYDKYDYVVPHFGEETEITATKKHLAEAEEALGHKMKASFASDNEYLLGGDGKKIERNYFVPNFGEDTDISDTKTNINLAQKRFNTTIEVKDYPEIKRNYFVPNFGIDKDVVDAGTTIAQVEKDMKHKLDVKADGEGSYDYVQTEADLQLESDPICNSAGCTQYEHPKKERGYKINYAVPNFGRDHDINTNFNSLEAAEGIVGHHWVWKHNLDKRDPVYYNDGGPLEDDVRNTMKHLKDQEAVNGVW